ncbi:hypothetical protein C7B62_08290 [Pleurocapsa sp. CCALA 161]|uniref:GNAT family N-acetyltransferase n=1 Tax=Pleurocapsa sp. CCALA 161 TaxID=2107688 RepID=UPI000D05E1FD|nr:GNAT family protein [Pleurocapsa sp. CCALA 161]PSB10686.1 hypothetical protein C7B62_08290 [Pleurocapsa sp. CCALA 161]
MFSLPILSTERLILRPLSIADAVSIPYPYPDGEAKRYVLKHTSEQQTGYFAFAIERQLESDLIGIVELHNLETEHSVADHMVRNSASGKVLQKNGFKLEGLLRQRVRKWDKYEDVKLFSLLQSDWQNNTVLD